jgi:hypothetical protein
MTTHLRRADREQLYNAPRKEPELVHVPEIGFAMIDGHGDPNTAPGYQDAIQALFALSYTLKFTLKKEQGLNYRVGPLESLFWADDMAEFGARKADWNWTMMIAQPDAVSPERFEAVRAEVGNKMELPALARARLERFEEGPCAQVLHVGPFSAEGPTIARLHAFIREHGHGFDGRVQKHHEIYLSDIRRAAPEKWKTVIRQPIAPEAAGDG